MDHNLIIFAFVSLSSPTTIFTVAASPVSSVSQPPPSPSPFLQKKLYQILQTQPEWWAYAILWQTAKDDSGITVLTCADGHFQGTKQKIPISDTVFLQPDKKKVMRGIHAFIGDSPDPIAPTHGDVTDAEWFYVMPLAQSISLGDGVVGKSFNSGSLVWLSSGNQLRFYNWGEREGPRYI